MIKPGIKIGPHDWKSRLEKSNAQYCEIWFRVDRLDWYQDVFAYLHQHHIQAGLHFWAIIDNRWEPNIAYPGRTLKPSIDLIKKSIDVAAKYKIHYVNIHCGNRALIRINLNKLIFIPDKNLPVISLEKATAALEKSLQQLHHYALKKDVLLLTETIPAKTSSISLHSPQACHQAIDYFNIPVNNLTKIALKNNFYITNDFGHTFADEYDQSLNKLWQSLWEKTVKLAPQTKLLHINTVTPPYNGTDSHCGITKKDFQLPGIFPTRGKHKKLLMLFKERDDVWALNEPFSNHVANYHSLVKLLSEL